MIFTLQLIRTFLNYNGGTSYIKIFVHVGHSYVIKFFSLNHVSKEYTVENKIQYTGKNYL